MEYLSPKVLLDTVSEAAAASSKTKNYTALMTSTAKIAMDCTNAAIDAIRSNGDKVNSNLVFYANAVENFSQLPKEDKLILVGSKTLSKTSIASARAIFEIIKLHPLASDLSEPQIYGILGNMAHESEFDPSLWEGQGARIWSTTKLTSSSKPAFGLAQFTYSEAALALENMILSWNKNNVTKLCDSNILASIIINPIYQIDHLLRSCLFENRVDRSMYYYNYNTLKANNFFAKGKDVKHYAKAFLLGYERPRDSRGLERIKRANTAFSLSKII